MTFISKVIRYFNIKKEQREIEIAVYDSVNDQNYFESFYPLVLENSFKGTIVCLGDVHIKKNASFSGELICRSCKIEGSFNGSLLSTEYTGVCNTAHLDAKIISASIFIESNAEVTGIFNITKHISNPDSINKLQATFAESMPRLDDEKQGEPVTKTIILRGKALNTIPAKPQVPVVIPAATDMIKQDIPVETLAHPAEKEMNRSETKALPAQNAGWW